jgi:hypothetical protein
METAFCFVESDFFTGQSKVIIVFVGLLILHPRLIPYLGQTGSDFFCNTQQREASSSSAALFWNSDNPIPGFLIG